MLTNLLLKLSVRSGQLHVDQYLFPKTEPESWAFCPPLAFPMHEILCHLQRLDGSRLIFVSCLLQ